MSQIEKRGLASNAVDGTKIRLSNNESLRVRNFANSADISLFKVNPSDEWEFQVLPKFGASNIATESFVTTAISGLDFIPTSEKGSANGVCPLDSNGFVPAINLPGFVDDVVEYANLAAFPVTGEAGIIYIDISTLRTYRWATTVYAEISPSAVTSVNGQTDAVSLDSDDIPEGATNKYFNISALPGGAPDAGSQIPFYDTTLLSNRYMSPSQLVGAATTDDLPEGLTNKYFDILSLPDYTIATNDYIPFYSQGQLSKKKIDLLSLFGSMTTDSLPEGALNKYYSDTAFDASFATRTTDVLAEGSVNLYFTDTRAKNAAVVNSTAGSETDQAPSVAAIKSYITTELANASSVQGESFVLTATDITNGYIDLAAEASEIIHVTPKGFPSQYPIDDYTLSVVSSVTRITFAGDMLSLVSGDKVRVSYSV